MTTDEPRGLFLVCDRCGFFMGDRNLYEETEAVCDECGSEALWAFPTFTRMRQYQADHHPERLSQKASGV